MWLIPQALELNNTWFESHLYNILEVCLISSDSVNLPGAHSGDILHCLLGKITNTSHDSWCQQLSPILAILNDKVI